VVDQCEDITCGIARPPAPQTYIEQCILWQQLNHPPNPHTTMDHVDWAQDPDELAHDLLDSKAISLWTLNYASQVQDWTGGYTHEVRCVLGTSHSWLILANSLLMSRRLDLSTAIGVPRSQTKAMRLTLCQAIPTMNQTLPVLWVGPGMLYKPAAMQ
jgi:hypothetical protein